MQNPRLFVCLALCVLAGCIDSRPPAAGQVFAGPAELVLHEDLNPKSKVTGTVHHGDKLDVVQQRRRMFQVRTASGVEGWTDERNLMSIERMQALAQLEQKVRRWPTQGSATTFEILNVHTEAQRFSPSFLQIKPGETFDVIAHATASRAEPKHSALFKPAPRLETSKKSSAKNKKTPLPAQAAAPKLPPDWLELSEARQPAPVTAPENTKPAKEEKQEPTPQDDWTLIRTSRGAAGWVLTSRIFLSVPDEVAQYAEGHRIVTYYSLGHVHDSERDVDKDTYLWTTIRAGRHPYDFDNVRVFQWNAHRHRYETAYIHKEAEGFLPIVVRKLDKEVTFSVCLNDDDGVRQGYTYSLFDNHVHAAGVSDCAKPETATEVSGSVPLPVAAQPVASLSQKLKQKAGEVKRKIIGR